MSEIITAADHASLQSDRWLFIFILILALAGGVLFWRWIVADREKVALRLQAMTDRYIESGEKLAEVVANNTAVLKEVQSTMLLCRNRREQDK